MRLLMQGLQSSTCPLKHYFCVYIYVLVLLISFSLSSKLVWVIKMLNVIVYIICVCSFFYLNSWGGVKMKLKKRRNNYVHSIISVVKRTRLWCRGGWPDSQVVDIPFGKKMHFLFKVVKLLVVTGCGIQGHGKHNWLTLCSH